LPSPIFCTCSPRFLTLPAADSTKLCCRKLLGTAKGLFCRRPGCAPAAT
jgi:hypothetical protein